MNDEVEKQLKWLLRRSSAIRNRGLTILAYLCSKTQGIYIDKTPYTHRTLFMESDESEIFVKTIPRSLGDMVRANCDGTMKEAKFFTALDDPNTFICGWKLSPYATGAMVRNKTLSGHERMRLEIALDLIETHSSCPHVTPGGTTYSEKERIYDDLLLRMQQRH